LDPDAPKHHIELKDPKKRVNGHMFALPEKYLNHMIDFLEEHLLVGVTALRLWAAWMGTGDRRVWRTKGSVRLTSCKLNYKVCVTAFQIQEGFVNLESDIPS